MSEEKKKNLYTYIELPLKVMFYANIDILRWTSQKIVAGNLENMSCPADWSIYWICWSHKMAYLLDNLPISLKKPPWSTRGAMPNSKKNHSKLIQNAFLVQKQMHGPGRAEKRAGERKTMYYYWKKRIQCTNMPVSCVAQRQPKLTANRYIYIY